VYLLSRLLEAQSTRRGSPFAGTSILTAAQRRAMERVLERELWSPPVEPLPLWSPPTFESPAEPEPCPNCGEKLAISRIDLTANASWLKCRACGLRWGGSIDRERGQVVAG
jgi:hypothetical protein